MKKINLNTWNRKEHFGFFNQMEEPFFGLTVDLDMTKAYPFCKEQGISFFLYYLHTSIKAANTIENLRYRIVGEEVIAYEVLHVNTVMLRTDKTFVFTYIPFVEDFGEFSRLARKTFEQAEATTGIGLNDDTSRPDCIHYSTLPWIHFRSFSHARGFSYPDSTPKFMFGKMEEKQGKLLMPMSINVHHALVDGYHVGVFLKSFQDLLRSCAL